jgi:phage gp36-like protein
MPYCTIDELKNKYTEQKIIELSSEGEAVDNDVINECIADADAEINGYVQKVYSTPLDPIPRLIKKLSLNLTIANLYERRNIDDEAISKLKNNAVQLLNRISKKSVSLGLKDDNDTSIQSSSILITSKPRIFSR